MDSSRPASPVQITPHSARSPRRLLLKSRSPRRTSADSGEEADGSSPRTGDQWKRRSLPEGRASVDSTSRDHHRQPHVKLTYLTPRRNEGASEDVPRVAPAPSNQAHPYGIELGMLLKMLQDTFRSGFLAADFSRVAALARRHLTSAGSPPPRPATSTGRPPRLSTNIQSTKIWRRDQRSSRSARWLSAPLRPVFPKQRPLSIRRPRRDCGRPRRVRVPFWTCWAGRRGAPLRRSARGSCRGA